MKKMSLSLLTAATVVIGAFTIAAPTQAATAIAPQSISYYYAWYHFDSYPPYGYSDPDTGFQGHRVSVIQNADGSYEGEYYGSDQI